VQRNIATDEKVQRERVVVIIGKSPLVKINRNPPKESWSDKMVYDNNGCDNEKRI
jgi:hypothetical protein